MKRFASRRRCPNTQMKTAAVTLALCLSVATGDERCIGGWQTGDGEGPLGSAYETSLGTADSREACIDAVQALSDGPNAATYSTDGYGFCYAEYGQTTVDTSCSWCSDWENCLFPIPTSAPTVSPAPTSSIPTAAPSTTAAPSVNRAFDCPPLLICRASMYVFSGHPTYRDPIYGGN